MLSTIQSNSKFYLSFYLETAEKCMVFNLFKGKFIDQYMIYTFISLC